MAESQQPPTDADTLATGTVETDATADEPSHGSLMRGRGLAVAAAVSLGLIAAVVIVSTNRDDSGSVDSSEAVDIAADATTVAEAEPQVSTDGPFEVRLEPGDDGLLQLTVADPATPAAADSPSQHCVLVTLSGPATVDAFGCLEAGSATSADVILSTPGEPMVGCASVTTREPESDVTATSATSEFVVNEGAALPQGEYEVTVVAITGIGDGCPPVDDGGVERETTARSSIVID